MSGAKKCGPHLWGAPQTQDRKTQARTSAAARPPHAAQFKPPARPSSTARPTGHAPVQPKRPPSAPPVYRPQPVPKVLQKKTPPGRPVENAQTSAPRPAQTPPRPAAPPVYRPEPKSVAQPKAVAGAHARPAQTTLQMKPGAASAATRPPSETRAATPPVRPQPQASAPQPRTPAPSATPRPAPSIPSRVVQRMEIDDQEMINYYGEDYWPPPKYPPSTPPTPTYNYYKWSSSYYENNTKVFDRYVDFYNDNSGKSVGMTSGTGEEDEFDESYVDIPSTLRPSAPSAKLLWKSIYSPLLPSTTDTSLVKVKCKELCGKWVYMYKSNKKEYGTSKRPPMCHVIPFNYIRWAAEWVYANKNSPSLSKPYKGPDPQQYPVDTWKQLVWDKKNLRPGHATCNSQTAHQAKGVPSSSDQKIAINYVIKKLYKLEPTWF